MLVFLQLFECIPVITSATNFINFRGTEYTYAKFITSTILINYF